MSDKKEKPYEIELYDLHKNDPIAWAKLVWEYDKSEVKNAFDSVNIEVNSFQDLLELAKMHKTGGDVAGDLKTPSGKKIRFDFMDIVKNKIPFPEPSKWKQKFSITSDKTLLVKE